MSPPAGGANVALHGILNQPPSLATGPAADVLRRLDLAITRRLDGMLQGDYRGLVPGHGSELGETRQYHPGDDVRRIDWNVTARMQTPYVRETIADRELETWVVADLSASLGFGTAECEKRDLAVAAVAAVGYLTARTGNRVGAITLGGPHASIIPARSGRINLQALLHQVVVTAKAEREGVSDLAGTLQRLNGTMRRRGLAVVVSDFLAPEGWERPLRALGARHETLAIELVDPRELELPDVGLIEVFDPETGDTREVNTANRALRDNYRREALAERERIARQIRNAGADHLVLRTDSDWLLDLVRFVALRRDRVDSLARARA